MAKILFHKPLKVKNFNESKKILQPWRILGIIECLGTWVDKISVYFYIWNIYSDHDSVLIQSRSFIEIMSFKAANFWNFWKGAIQKPRSQKSGTVWPPSPHSSQTWFFAQPPLKNHVVFWLTPPSMKFENQPFLTKVNKKQIFKQYNSRIFR